MNAAMTAILQQSPTASAPRGRHDTSSSSDRNEFSDLVKADGKSKSATSSTEKDESLSQSELASDLELLRDELANASQETVSPDSAEAEGQKGSETDEEAQGAEALLPFLTVPQQRSPVPTGESSAENTAGPKGADAADLMAKAAKAAQGAANERRNTPSVTIVEKPDPAMSAGRTEATFGKTLIANLNDIATQASGQAEARPDKEQSDREAADPLMDRRGVRRDRGTLTADAIVRARQAQDIGERQADLKPAEQRLQPIQLGQAPLSTGAPVVQAVAGHTASATSLHRAAMANADGQPAASLTQALKIQLKPVELGTVTAHLRMTGDQLSVEIEVESAEAYKRLASETDAIARALRSHGIAVEEVVIQAPQVQAGAAVRDGSTGFGDNSSNAGRNFSTGAESGQSGGSDHPKSNAGQDNGHETDRLSSSEIRTVSGSNSSGVYI